MSDQALAEGEQSRALERRPSGVATAVVSGRTPDEILKNAGVIAASLKGLIDSQGLSVSVGGTKRHVEVGAWQACGTMLGALGGQPLHAETVWTRRMLGDDGITPQRTRYTAEVKRYKGKGQARELTSTTTYEVDGYDWEARVEVRTVSGEVVGSAEAMCARSEETWSKRDDQALRSMAETRAESRAYRRAIGWIIHMAGYSPTPAEEMGHQPGAHTEAATMPHGPEASEALQATLLKALAFVFDTGDGPREDLALAAFNVIGGKLGYIPSAVGQAIALAAGELKRALEPPSHPDQAAQESGAEPQTNEEAQGGGPAAEEEPVDGEAVPDDDPTETPPTPLDPDDEARANEAFQGGST